MQQKTGFEQPEYVDRDWRESIRASWIDYLVTTLGRPMELALSRSDREISRATVTSFCEYLESIGIPINGMDILEVGSGHGTLSIELANRGAKVIAIEPCKGWRDIAIARSIEEMPDAQISFIDGDAEDLPFNDQSFDLVISRQVLEHVKSPRQAIEEMSRVVKRSGNVYIGCENYLAFREQHYDIFWLPLLPKRLAATYLRAVGKDPDFLLHHITYTTFPQLLWWCIDAELWSDSWGTRPNSNNIISKIAILARMKVRQLFGIGFHFLLHPSESTKRNTDVAIK